MIPDNFINHIVFEKLEQLKQALLEENTKERIGIDNSVFFESFYLFTADRLRLTIPVLVQETELVNLASEIESGTSQLNAFLGKISTPKVTCLKALFTNETFSSLVDPSILVSPRTGFEKEIFHCCRFSSVRCQRMGTCSNS